MLAGEDVSIPAARRSILAYPAGVRRLAQPLPLNPRQRNLHLGTLCRRTDPVPARVPAQWRDTPTSGTLSFDCPTPPAFGGTQFGSVA